MLKKIRITLAAIFFTLIALLFLDFTGTLHAWFGWLAKIQFIPAVLALNFAVIAVLLVLTLLFGRVYCSVICPLGVFQDIVSFFSGRRKKKKFRFTYSPAKNWLRYIMLGLFILAIIFGIGSFVALLDPYASFGRITSNLFAPLWQWGNNLCAYFAERADSYAFYRTDVWLKSLPTFIVAAATFIIIIVLAWRGGRTYCNTICPVGTVLGFFSRFSLFRISIDAEKCVGCGLCGRKCKASCLNTKEHKIDYSRCVACMDCIGACAENAITYKWRFDKDNGAKKSCPDEIDPADNTCKTIGGTATKSDNNTPESPDRREFLAGLGLLATASIAKAQEKVMDGGLAVIEDKKIPARETPLVPAGASGLRNLARHCTGCQLCVSACPNGVLRPSTELKTLMQPEMSYERGYCRPECTKCSEVCPTGAIRKITKAEKSSIQIGHSVWIRENCVIFSDHVLCGHCAEVCPVGAIDMVEIQPDDEGRPTKIPVVNTERCIGCGACENLCPARPFSAIYVEGHEMHRTI